MPNMNPVHGKETIVSDLVYSASAANVNTTIVDGKVLMQNRQLQTMNLEQIVQDAGAITRKLIQA